MRVLGVLPLGLDAVLEQVVRGRGLQLAGRLDIVVQTACRQQGGGCSSSFMSCRRASTRDLACCYASVGSAGSDPWPQDGMQGL